MAIAGDRDDGTLLDTVHGGDGAHAGFNRNRDGAPQTGAALHTLRDPRRPLGALLAARGRTLEKFARHLRN
jgi:hypothetical protein